MWITKREFVTLIERASGADARIEALVMQCNVLARRAADLEQQITGKAVDLPVFEFKKAAARKPQTDWSAGIDFNDMGDVEAHRQGITEDA